jgi:hypothetical protein
MWLGNIEACSFDDLDWIPKYVTNRAVDKQGHR